MYKEIQTIIVQSIFQLVITFNDCYFVLNCSTFVLFQITND